MVTGFPSKIAALQFEWALQHPGLTRHLDSAERLKHHARRGLAEKLSVLHLLLSSRSFARWPLDLRFLVQDVYAVWENKVRPAMPLLCHGVTVVPSSQHHDQSADDPNVGCTAEQLIENEKEEHKVENMTKISAIELSYNPARQHFMKSDQLAGHIGSLQCSICKENFLDRGEQFLTCPCDECSMISHVTCLSSHFLQTQSSQQDILPTVGKCPSCQSQLAWSDLVRDLSLRIRASEQTVRLLRRPEGAQKRRTKGDVSLGGHTNSCGTGPASTAATAWENISDLCSDDDEDGEDDQLVDHSNIEDGSTGFNESSLSDPELPDTILEPEPPGAKPDMIVANSDFEDIEEILG